MTVRLLLCCLLPLVSLNAQKRIYIAADDHTDYLWTADEETYRRVFVEMIDYYLDLADATSTNPAEHQSRWNCDGSLWLWTYEKNKSPEEFQRLIGRIRDGHISVPLNALVSCYGAQPAEAVLRGMYYPGRIQRRYGLKFPVAIAMENQTLPYGLGALWAGAGARYTWKGICGCASKMKRNEPRPHEVYWWRGPDGSRVLMKWYTLLENNKLVGGYAEAYDPAASVDFVDRDPRFTGIHPYPVIGVFGKGWDHLKTLTDEFVTVAKAKSNESRQVIVSNQLDYFRDIEARHGDELPEFGAAFGNEWDLYSASLTEVSAKVRRSVERLRAAEALATLVSRHRPEFLEGRKTARERAWMNLGLYWEHNWTADGKTITKSARAAWQRRLAAEIEAYVDDLYRDARYALGDMIAAAGDQQRFYVFNPLSWRRSDVADIPLDSEEPVHAIDLGSGRETPSQVVTLPDATYQKGKRWLRIHAEGVPPVGYKVYEIRPGPGSASATTVRAMGNQIENEFYRIRLENRGAIASWIDKHRGNREMVRQTANDLGTGTGTLSVENAGPVSATLIAESAEPVARTTRVTLYRGSPRVDIRNEITENFADVREWAFDFNLETPRVWHEEVGAVIQARRQSDGGHYADTNARLDYLTLNHFADMGGSDGAGVTLSNADCAFMQLGHGAFDIATPRISVLAGGQVDGPRLGIDGQGGDDYFLQRFALRTRDRYSAADAMRFALEHQNPLVTGAVRGGDSYPEESFSLLTIDDPDVLLWALKPAEEGIGQGLVARVWNLASEDRQFTLRLDGGIAEAARATHIETDTAPAPVSDGTLSTSIRGSEIETFRLKPRPSTVFPDAAWQERSPESQGVDPGALRKALDYLASEAGGDGTDETVVIRNGHLIWKGPLAGNKHTIYSCTKTFTSTVLGLLIEDGKLSLDDYAREYFPTVDDDYPLYAGITIRQLASMTSGYRGESGERTNAHRWGEPSEYLKPHHPPANDPGAAFRYNDHGVHLLGAILTRLAGEPLEEFFRRRVGEPIGLRDWEWGDVGSFDGIRLNSPSGIYGTGITTTPLELARYGHLYLNHGRWHGKQVLPRWFVNEATSNQVATDIEHSNTDGRGRYGLYWWTNGLMATGARPWPSAPPNAYTARGMSRNFLMIVPEWNMVIVRMSREQDMKDVDSTWEGFFSRLALGVSR